MLPVTHVSSFICKSTLQEQQALFVTRQNRTNDNRFYIMNPLACPSPRMKENEQSRKMVMDMSTNLCTLCDETRIYILCLNMIALCCPLSNKNRAFSPFSTYRLYVEIALIRFIVVCPSDLPGHATLCTGLFQTCRPLRKLRPSSGVQFPHALPGPGLYFQVKIARSAFGVWCPMTACHVKFYSTKPP